MKLAIANQKGGVGKTTTAVNLSAAWALMNKRVLLIDADSQANASIGVGLEGKEPNLYDLLTGNAELKDVIYRTRINGLDCIPSTPDLIGVEAIRNQKNWEYRLKDALRGLNYDFIVIDTPPSLGTLTILALTAAEKVLIPVQAEYYALEGLAQLLDTIKYIQASLNPKLGILGLLITMYDKRIRLSQEVYEEIYRHFQDKVFRTVIPRNVKLAEAPSFGLPAILHSPDSSGSYAYVDLAKEILERLKDEKVEQVG
jgi:chromosome partitioning protein